MAKRTFVCTACQNESSRWLGTCPNCGEVGTLEEGTSNKSSSAAVALKPAASNRMNKATTNNVPVRIRDVKKHQNGNRLKTNIGELDRVLGGGLVSGGVALLAGAPGAGKALALDTPMPTPSGWTTMGEVQVGDLIYGHDGQPTKVVAMTEIQENRPCFEVQFSDGTSIIADENHEWLTVQRDLSRQQKKEAVVTTREIEETLVAKWSDARKNHAIVTTLPILGEEKELLIPPYTFGAWLGDGHSHEARFTTPDLEVIENIKSEGVLVKDYTTEYLYGLFLPEPKPDFYTECFICNSALRNRVNSGFCNDHKYHAKLARRLRMLNVYGNKHIPMEYLRASIAQRRALLAGLLDTDGTISKSGGINFGVTSKQLADGFYELVVGLGYRAQKTTKQVKGGSEATSTFHMVTFTTSDMVFRLQKKASRIPKTERATQKKRYIVSVTPVESVQVKCIEVDNEAHMYLAGASMVPTHNSTLLGHITQTVAEQDKTVLYISGEENETQIASRHERINATHNNILILSESNTDNAENAILSIKPDLIIVDSVQTLLSPNSEGRIGSPSQVTEVANLFTNIAKKLNIPTIMIGHLTKNESIAGPRVVEHLVDVVLYLEASPDTTLRMLRGVKNRFGSTDEVGLFEHADTGLLEISDPSGFFANPHEDGISGYASTIIVEGMRAILSEVNCLITASPLPNPRKISHGLDHARCMMVQAILEKHAGLKIGDKDVYISTTGGLIVKDSSIDLAIAAGLISSFYDIPPLQRTVYLGELSLTGEVRAARFNDRRKKEAERLGFKVYDYASIKTIRDLVNMVHKDLGKKK